MRNTFQVLFGAHGKLPITTDLTQPLLPRDQPAAGNTATNLGQVGLPFCEAPIVHPDVLKRIDELLRRYRVDGSPFEIQSFLKNTVLTLPLAALGVRLIRTAAAIPFPNKYTTIGDFRSMTSLLWLKAPITREALSNALAASATTPLGSTDDQAAAQRDLLDALVPYQNELDPTVAPGWLAVAAWFENPAWLRTLLCNGIFSSPTVAFMALKLYLDWHNDDTAQLSLEATKRLLGTLPPEIRQKVLSIAPNMDTNLVLCAAHKGNAAAMAYFVEQGAPQIDIQAAFFSEAKTTMDGEKIVGLLRVSACIDLLEQQSSQSALDMMAANTSVTSAVINNTLSSIRNEADLKPTELTLSSALCSAIESPNTDFIQSFLNVYGNTFNLLPSRTGEVALHLASFQPVVLHLLHSNGTLANQPAAQERGR